MYSAKSQFLGDHNIKTFTYQSHAVLAVNSGLKSGNNAILRINPCFCLNPFCSDLFLQQNVPCSIFYFSCIRFVYAEFSVSLNQLKTTLCKRFRISPRLSSFTRTTRVSSAILSYTCFLLFVFIFYFLVLLQYCRSYTRPALKSDS